MLGAVKDIEPFNPSVFGLKDKPIEETPTLRFHKAIDDVRQIPGSEETRKVFGFNAYNAKDKFIGWLYVFIGGLGSLSYAEYKPDNPREVFVFNQMLYAGLRDSDEDLVDLSQRCARHYHEHIINNSRCIKWIPIDVAVTELVPNQHSKCGKI